MSRQSQRVNFHVSLCAAVSALVIVFALTVVATTSMQAQTYKVIYTFSGGSDGAYPAGLTMDRGGNLYGTAGGGGDYGGTCGEYGCGTVYQLLKKGSGWLLNPLYKFSGGSDGADPTLRVVFGPDGGLYGTTGVGGGDNFGVVFNLRPPATVCKTTGCLWTEKVLYSFTGGNDGADPGEGPVVFDNAGNIYGTTSGRGASGYGNVYELLKSNGTWVLNELYSFTGKSDGGVPYGGVIFDSAGNLYGTAYEGGKPSCNCGAVFQLTPSGPGWKENVLYAFQNPSDGGYPYGGLILDQFQNLYGTTVSGGPNGGGTVFSVVPSGGGWTYSLLYGLSGPGGGATGPVASLVMDNAGNLYGTTIGGVGVGSAFELSPSNGGWTYKLLHQFSYGSEGAIPAGNIVLDAAGNLYGTATQGGKSNCGVQGLGCGVVWEITP